MILTALFVIAGPPASHADFHNSYYDFLGTSGSKRLVVLLAKTKDSRTRLSPEEVWSRFFSRDDDDVLSVAEYYDHVSYGAVHLEGTVSNWIELDHTMEYYAARRQGKGTHVFPRNMAGFVTETARKAYTGGVPLDNFDNAGDGHIDGLVVMYAGPLRNEEDPKQRLWPRMDYVSVYGSSPVPMGNAVMDRFILVPEYIKAPDKHEARVYAHETGHLFGLFDLYDKDRSSYGIGSTGLMGMAPPSPDSRPITGLTAFSKYVLGWARPVIVNEDTTITLRPLDKSPEILKIPSGEKDEYFLLSYREPEGMDRNIYGKGLLLWHVNEHAIYENRYECKGLCEAGPLLSLVQADGKNDLERRMKSADPADFFANDKAEIGADTGASDDPFAGAHTMTYGGLPTGIRIKNINVQDQRAQVSVSVTDKAVPWRDYPYFKIIDAQWTEISGNGNGFPEKGELALLTMTVINLGKKAENITISAGAPETYWYDSSKKKNKLGPGEKWTFEFKVRLSDSNSFEEAWNLMLQKDGAEKRADEGHRPLQAAVTISCAKPEVEMELGPRLFTGVPEILMINDSPHDLFPYCLKSLKRAKIGYTAWDVREQGLPSLKQISAVKLVIWLCGNRTLQQGIYPGPDRTELMENVLENGNVLWLSASRSGDRPPQKLLEILGTKNMEPAAGFRMVSGYPGQGFSKDISFHTGAPYYPVLTPHLKLSPVNHDQRFLKDSRGNCIAVLKWKSPETRKGLSAVFTGFPYEALRPPHAASLCKRILDMQFERAKGM